MRVAIITDTHYGCRKGSKHLHEYFEKFYDDVFFPALEEHGVDTVVHMGDAFDSRKSIDYQSLQWAKRVVFDPLKEEGIKMHLIVGNHHSNQNEGNTSREGECCFTGPHNRHLRPHALMRLTRATVCSRLYFAGLTAKVAKASSPMS